MRLGNMTWMTALAVVALASVPLRGATSGGQMLHLQPPSEKTVDLRSAGAVQRDAAVKPRASSALTATPRAAASGNKAANSEGPGCRIAPVSPSVGADIPEFYFGPSPSTVNPSLIGPVQLLTSGPVDTEAETVTLPLYRGVMSGRGENVFYILTDTTDAGNAAALGLNFAAKLEYSQTGRGVRLATLMRDGLLVFDAGKVDFEPQRRVRAGGRPASFPPSFASPFGRPAFPPAEAEPGSVGDASYTPLVQIVNAGGHVYNAPVIAFDVEPDEIHFPNGNPDYSKVHDKVVAIDTINNTVTLSLTPGFSFARPVLYLSTESSAPDVAALEGATYTPALGDIETGNDDSAFSAVERIFVTINGATGCENPQRQGLESALLDGRGPFNVLGGIPTVATDYSPLWDVNLGQWTEDAIEKGYRSRVTEEFQILGLAEAGFITGPDGAEYGSIGVIVNCPIVFRFL